MKLDIEQFKELIMMINKNSQELYDLVKEKGEDVSALTGPLFFKAEYAFFFGLSPDISKTGLRTYTEDQTLSDLKSDIRSNFNHMFNSEPKEYHKVREAYEEFLTNFSMDSRRFSHAHFRNNPDKDGSFALYRVYTTTWDIAINYLTSARFIDYDKEQEFKNIAKELTDANKNNENNGSRKMKM